MKLFEKVIMANGNTVYHGKYAYKLNIWTGDITRCKRGDENRQWIDTDGNIISAWEIVALG